MVGKDKHKQKHMSDFVAVSKGRGGMPCAGKSGEPVPASEPPRPEMEIQGTGDAIDLAAVMREIQLFRTDMTTKSDRLEMKMDLFQVRCNSMEGRIKELEERLSSMEDRLPGIAELQGTQSTSIKALEAGLDGLENRGRRNNVRVVGLPEGSESGHLTEFFEKFLRDVLPNAKFSNYYSVVRAHRSLGPRPAPGAPPRAVLIRFLHFCDRDAVLTAAREKGELRFGNSRIQCFQDLSIGVQKERKRFDVAKKMLRDKGIRYGMMFPARLRVEVMGKVFFFSDPKAACDFAERHINTATAETANARLEEI